MKTRSFTVLLYKEDEMYVAECPEVGTVDQGETIEQAIANLKEATRLYLTQPILMFLPKQGYVCQKFTLSMNSSQSIH
jgi:predicted RNase H-like HicB family nuclease